MEAVTSRGSSSIGYWELRNNNVRSPADFATYDIKWWRADPARRGMLACGGSESAQ